MKKILVIVLLMMFSVLVTGTAFAGKQTFVDVPAKHWAYEAVNKLAKTGIIDGYADHTFRGDKVLTRYEMAQIVLRAMERSDNADIAIQALIEKLAAEFLPELKTMQTRINTLEKKQSSIKFWGDARIRYQDNWDLRHLATFRDCSKHEHFQERIRIYTQADLNDKLEFQGRISAEHTSNENRKPWLDSGSVTNPITWDYGKFIFKDVKPHINVELGRSELLLGQGLVAATDGGFDSIRVTVGGKINGFYAYGDIAPATGAPFNYVADAGSPPDMEYFSHPRAANVSALNLNWSPNDNLTLSGSALYSHSYWYPYQIFAIGFVSKLNDFTLTAEGAKNFNKDKFEFPYKDDKTAWMTSLWYKGAQKNIKGSWGVYLDYRDIGSGAIDGKLSILNGLDPEWPANTGYGYWSTGVKGIGYGFNYTLSKNAVVTGSLERLKTKESNAAFSNLLSIKIDFSF